MPRTAISALLLVACSGSRRTDAVEPPPPNCPPPRGAASSSVAPAASQAVPTQKRTDARYVLEFDCSVDQESKRGERLRADNGGPQGATWNWQGDLTCWAIVSQDCEKPESQFSWLEFGQLPRIAPARIDQSGDNWRVEFELKSTVWMPVAQGLDRPESGHARVPLRFETKMVCGDVPNALMDTFVGRFGYGE